MRRKKPTVWYASGTANIQIQESLINEEPEHMQIDKFIPSAEYKAIKNGTSTYLCDSALSSAIDSLPAVGGLISFGPGVYRFSETIHLKKYVILEGEGSGQDGGAATVLQFPNNKTGIVVHRYNTDASGIVAAGGRGDGSIIRNLSLWGSGGAYLFNGTVGHGIWMRARAELNNVTIRAFSQNGIN